MESPKLAQDTAAQSRHTAQAENCATTKVLQFTRSNHTKAPLPSVLLSTAEEGAPPLFAVRAAHWGYLPDYSKDHSS